MTSLLLAVHLLLPASNVFGEYRYALIVKGREGVDVAAPVEALKQHGFLCTEANWRTEREFRRGVADFMSRTAVNSKALILYSGNVSIVESKSKEQRGQESLGIHVNGLTSGFPLVDLTHLMNTIGGSRNNLVLIDTKSSVVDPQLAVPSGCAVLVGRTSSLVERLKAGGLLTSNASTALSPSDRFVEGRMRGDEWVNNHGMVFRWCPSGSFRDSLGREVIIKEGFWMMKYEWTRGQIMGKGDLRNSPGNHKLHALGKFGFRELPNQLKRFNAEERKAGRLPKEYEYALPSEAQWEYVARAGSTAKYCFGDDPAQLAAFGNFADKSYYDTGSIYSNYGHRTFDDGEAGIAMVGAYKPNAWGFYDMHGNVSEYCDNGACRGGSWISTVDSCSFAFRDGRWGHNVGEYQGYRFVIRRVLPDSGKQGPK